MKTPRTDSLLDPATHLPMHRTPSGGWTSPDGSRVVTQEEAADFEVEALAYATDPYAGRPVGCWPRWTNLPIKLAR